MERLAFYHEQSGDYCFAMTSLRSSIYCNTERWLHQTSNIIISQILSINLLNSVSVSTSPFAKIICPPDSAAYQDAEKTI